jgi:hypothetical protein
LPVVSALADIEADPYEVNLWAAKDHLAGIIEVWNDATELHVTYTTLNGWMLTETHLAVAQSVTGIPQVNGNPVPGQFTWKAEHDPAVFSYEYVVNLEDAGIAAGDTVCIATHAVVILGDWEETAWAANWPPFEFHGSNWAWYFRYTVEERGTPG